MLFVNVIVRCSVCKRERRFYDRFPVKYLVSFGSKIRKFVLKSDVDIHFDSLKRWMELLTNLIAFDF